MTAEQDFPERRRPGGFDPLMAVIGGEPLPEAARADVALVAAHRSAEADVALLREQLGLLGDALADAGADASGTGARVAGAKTQVSGAGATAPPAVRPSRRRPFTLALGGLAVACAAAFLSGTAWLLTQSGGAGGGAAGDAAAGSEAGVLFGSPRYLACARIVAEGTVTDAEPVPGADRTRITLDVTRAYKPQSPREQAEPEASDADADPLVFHVRNGVAGTLHEGGHVLVGLPHRGDHPDALFTDGPEIAAERARVLRSLPASRGLTCPGG